MRILSIVLVWLIPIGLWAQNTPKQVRVDSIIDGRAKILDLLKKIDSGQADYKSYYQIASAYSLAQDYPPAFSNLKEAILHGAKGEDVMTDTDFDGMRMQKESWMEIDLFLKAQYLQKNPGIRNLDVGFELWQIWVEDQRFRTLRKNYRLPGKPSGDLELHKIHLIRVKEIIQSIGWPKYSEVGREGGDAVFFVFQHDEAKNMKPILPLLIFAAKAGEADLSKAAMMIDRYLAYTEKVQIYGTQAFRKIKPGQNRNDIPLELYPIVDEEKLFERRDAIGMVDFFENCRKLGVEYVPIEKRVGYKKIEMKKKWIEDGFLLKC